MILFCGRKQRTMSWNEAVWKIWEKERAHEHQDSFNRNMVSEERPSVKEPGNRENNSNTNIFFYYWRTLLNESSTKSLIAQTPISQILCHLHHQPLACVPANSRPVPRAFALWTSYSTWCSPVGHPWETAKSNGPLSP